MKKYFVVSDIHSFFSCLKKALDKAKFDLNNPEHILVVLGDVFDRGPETKKTYEFLRDLPKERKILVKGNHEGLYKQLLDKSFPDSYDFSNGTVKTFCQIAGFKEEMLEPSYWYKVAFLNREDIDMYSHIPYEYWRQIQETVKESSITKWLDSDEWLDYWETDHYIFVHSFIPTNAPLTNIWGTSEKETYRDDWRYANQYEWDDATWGCPWKKALKGLNQTGKTIVCGHWHTADFFNNLKKLKTHYDVYVNNPIFKSKRYKLIGLDACTAATYKVNVLVLNEDEL